MKKKNALIRLICDNCGHMWEDKKTNKCLKCGSKNIEVIKNTRY